DYTSFIHHQAAVFLTQKLKTYGQISLDRAEFAPGLIINVRGDMRGDNLAVRLGFRIHVSHGIRKDPSRNVLEDFRLEDMNSGEHERGLRIARPRESREF